MSRIYWEFQEHVIAVTGESYYAPDYYGPTYSLACIECKAQPDRPLIAVFWRAEEWLLPAEIQVDYRRAINALSEHLCPTAPMSLPLLEAAITLAVLSADVGVGVDLLHEQLGLGGEVINRDV